MASQVWIRHYPMKVFMVHRIFHPINFNNSPFDPRRSSPFHHRSISIKTVSSVSSNCIHWSNIVHPQPSPQIVSMYKICVCVCVTFVWQLLFLYVGKQSKIDIVVVIGVLKSTEVNFLLLLLLRRRAGVWDRSVGGHCCDEKWIKGEWGDKLEKYENKHTRV